MEYSLTWKDWATPAGRPFCLLRASGRRTSGTEFGGWPTPNVPNGGRSPADGTMSATGMTEKGKRQADLGFVARMAGWATPQAREQCQRNSADSYAALSKQVEMAGWCTPTSRDHKGIDQNFHDGAVNNSLPNQASGLLSTSSPAGTEKRGALNPAHSRWLIGFPAAWDACAATATPSCRKSRRSS
jgi:hypothetical protein